jgi:D-glycero-alpha-D-manno-heptose-7-phosphate kinase
MIITRTPLRISLLGGNTDFPDYFLHYGGVCVSTSINKYIYCIVKKRFDDLIIINYSKKEIVDKIDDIEHDLVRECLRFVGIERGMEISFLADIPTEGTGLGSSSAVTVGLLNALYIYQDKQVDRETLAEETCHIEINILKKPIGVQDQFACSFGGLNGYLFGTSSGTVVQRIRINESVKEDFNNSLMLLYTNQTRKSEEVLKNLNHDVDVLNENKKLALDGIDYLTKGDLRSFGQSLHKYWEHKKTLSDSISNTEIDAMYDKAMNAGAIGGKVVGAGGGGFLLVMFPANRRAVVRGSLKDYKELPFRFEKSGTKVIFNAD